jgi:hypothetical protein
VSRDPQSEILDNNFVVSGFNQSLRFFHLARCVYFKTMLREVFSHGKTDRLFIVDDEQIPWTGLGVLAGNALFPATEKL